MKKLSLLVLIANIALPFGVFADQAREHQAFLASIGFGPRPPILGPQPPLQPDQPHTTDLSTIADDQLIEEIFNARRPLDERVRLAEEYNRRTGSRIRVQSGDGMSGPSIGEVPASGDTNLSPVLFAREQRIGYHHLSDAELSRRIDEAFRDDPNNEWSHLLRERARRQSDGQLPRPQQVFAQPDLQQEPFNMGEMLIHNQSDTRSMESGSGAIRTLPGAMPGTEHLGFEERSRILVESTRTLARIESMPDADLTAAIEAEWSMNQRSQEYLRLLGEARRRGLR